MISIKSTIYWGLFLITGYTFTADNDPLVREIREWQQQQEQTESTVLQDFSEGFGLVINTVTENTQVLARELQTFSGAESTLLKPMSLGLLYGTIYGTRLFITNKFHSTDKAILAVILGREIIKDIRNITNQTPNNESISFLMPIVAQAFGSYIGSKSINAALEYIKADKVAHTVFQNTIESSIAAATKAKPIVESYCSIQ